MQCPAVSRTVGEISVPLQRYIGSPSTSMRISTTMWMTVSIQFAIGDCAGDAHGAESQSEHENNCYCQSSSFSLLLNSDYEIDFAGQISLWQQIGA